MALIKTSAFNASRGATTGSISYRVSGHMASEMLTRAIPHLVIEPFGQSYPLPTNSTKTMTFRRYEALDATPVVVAEGVTPSSGTVTTTDIDVTLKQYGSFLELTDVVSDTSNDRVLMEFSGLLGEQAAQMIERMRFGVLLAGTNVFYANGTARNAVNTPITLNLIRKVVRHLKGQLGDKFTKIVRSTPSYATQNVLPSYVAICSHMMDADLRAISSFTDAKDYGQVSPWMNEIGSVEEVRFVYSTLIDTFEDAGGVKGTMLSTSGTKADVYPVLFLAREAFGLVPLKGSEAVKPMVLNPNSPRGGDPLGQKGSVAWKTMQACVILNQAWIVRAEVACSAL